MNPRNPKTRGHFVDTSLSGNIYPLYPTQKCPRPHPQRTAADGGFAAAVCGTRLRPSASARLQNVIKAVSGGCNELTPLRLPKPPVGLDYSGDLRP